MAGTRIPDLPHLPDTEVAAEDLLVIYDASEDATKSVPPSYATHGVVGPPGPPGAQGPPGVGGSAVAEWNWSTATTANPPNATVQGNNANQTLITAIYIDDFNVIGSDTSRYLMQAVAAGQKLFIQQKTNATFWQTWKVTGPAVHDATNAFITIPVTWDSGGTALPAGPVAVTLLAPALASGLPEAPNDGKAYARKSAAWAQLAAPDISGGAALTSTNDTNVTVTLGGAPTTALLAATSLILGWVGSLSVARGGTGATTLTGYVKGNATAAFTAVSSIPGSDITGNITGNAANVTGTVAVANGGTAITSYTIGDLLYASASGVLSKLADVATGNALLSGGVGAAPAYGKVGLTTHVSGVLPVASGGTNLTSYTAGDILYATGATTLASLADIATGNVLLSGGVGVVPTYGKVGLTTHVSGILPVANGGTGIGTLTGLVVGNGTGAFSAVVAPAGTVVGTTDAQTLTNKTMALGSNTITGTLAQFNTACTDADFAPITSPTFLGTPAAPTATVGTNTTQLATTQFVTTAVGNYLLLTGGTLSGKLNTVASAAGGAGFNLPPGAAPTAPVNGDMWTTTASIYVRINGVTKDLLGGGSGIPEAPTDGQLYSRRGSDASWQVSPSGGGGGITDAPSDSTFYGRKSAAWVHPTAADITAGAAITKTDDTNVTLTLGGAPTTAVLTATSFTLGWTGTLSVARGGTGAATLTGYVKGNGASAMTAVSTIPGTDISGNIAGNAANVTGTIAVASGGTNITSYAVGDMLYASATGVLSKLADVATGSAIISGGVGIAPSYGKIGLTTHISGVLPVANGGTNISSYAVGDILYASAAGVLSPLADVATGNVLLSGGVGVAAAYGKVGLTTHVTGTLPVANGGTGATTLTGVVIGNGTSAMTTVAAPAGTIVGTTDTQTLSSKRINPRVVSAASAATITPNGDTTDVQATTALAVAATIAAPTGTPVDGQQLTIRIADNGTARALTWNTVYDGVVNTLPATTIVGKVLDINFVYNTTTTKWEARDNSYLVSSTVVPAALTAANDTNVTLTLGGTPATALLQAASLTLGWTGVLAPARGGTGAGILTQGSVDFIGAAGVQTQDNANFFWDATNKRLGIGTNAPGVPLSVVGAVTVGTVTQAGTAALTTAGLLHLTGAGGINIQLRYDGSSGVHMISTTQAAAPDLLFFNNGGFETARVTNAGDLKATNSVIAPNVNTAIGGFCSGVPTASEVVAGAILRVATTVTAGNCAAIARVAATASTVFTIYKQTGAAAATTVGTFTFAASGKVATVSISAGAITAGDFVFIQGPASPDTALADIAFLVTP